MKIFGGILIIVIFGLGFFLFRRSAIFDDWQKVEIFDDQNNLIAEFNCEIADTPVKRARGLMFRESLDENRGMLFIFPDEKNHSFWMKNTLISLDIIFINQDKQIVGIVENAEPENSQQLKVDRPSKYVLEIKSGLVEKYEIETGQKFKFKLKEN